MTFGSLFSGIGGIDLGLERSGMKCKWQVEIDPYCRRILRKHWPDIPKAKDVSSFPERKHGDVRVDVIAGGFPCQDASVANPNGGGINGPRTGLWRQFARIVEEIKPRWVFAENVPGLVNKGLEKVISDLSALGYDAEWGCLPAAAFGAPHLRYRLAVVAYPQHRGCQGGGTQRARASAALSCREVPDSDGLGREPRGERAGREAGNQSPNERATDSDAERDGVEEPRVFKPHARIEPVRWWDVEPDVGRVAHGVPRRVDRLRGLGNAVVPFWAEWIGRRLMELGA